MDIGRDRTFGIRFVKILGANLNADGRTALEIHRPLNGIGCETGRSKCFEAGVESFCGDDKIDIGSGHGFAGPVIHGQTADHAPRYFIFFKNAHQCGDIPGSTRRLPVVELSQGHEKNGVRWSIPNAESNTLRFEGAQAFRAIEQPTMRILD